jgi:hypothetical protein
MTVWIETASPLTTQLGVHLSSSIEVDEQFYRASTRPNHPHRYVSSMTPTTTTRCSLISANELRSPGDRLQLPADARFGDSISCGRTRRARYAMSGAATLSRATDLGRCRLWTGLV